MSERFVAVPGAFVALISTGWSRRIDGKRQIHKVFKNGNFTLLGHDGEPKPQQWKPTSYGTAHKTGEHGRYGREHLEPWTDAIVEEIRARKARHGRDARRAHIVEALKPSNADVPEHVLHQIETALKSAGYLLEQN